MSNPLKVLWVSNAPYGNTGYANQTNLFTRALQKAGHQPMVRGFYGHRNTTMGHGQVPVLPATYDDYGQDVLVYDYDRRNPDVTVLLYDIWVYNPELLKKIPLTAYAPIDHDPAPPKVIENLSVCRWIWAMSRFGERQMRQAGLDPFYMPHAVDTKVYHPKAQTEARRKWGVENGRFFVVSTAANKGYPSRKNLDKILKAWSLFVQKHPTALLYLHTNTGMEHGGYNLISMVRFYDIPEESIRFPDQNRLRDGEISEVMLNDLYNAADVFLLPSAGEGFGIPVIEAQSAGCPVIVTDFTAQSELGEAGYKIPVDPVDDLYCTGMDSEQAWVRPSAIIKALEWGLEQQGNAALREAAREFAILYDIDRVMERYTLPTLQIMAQGNAELRPRPVQKVIPDGRSSAVLAECKEKGHDWAPLGIWNNKILCFPCTRPECEAELRHDVTHDTMTIIPDGFKSEINGVPIIADNDPVCKVIMKEVEQSYNLDSIPFEPGDTVIDIGAHVGIVSIYLAKKHPGINVYAFEPVANNFERLERNAKDNGISNPLKFHMVHSGVTSDGREITLSGNPDENSGGMSAYTHPNGHSQTATSVTLESILTPIAGRIKLLKIDCEGAEYEILQTRPELLARVDHLRGEFHINERLRNMGCDPVALEALCKQYIPDVQVHSIEIEA